MILVFDTFLAEKPLYPNPKIEKLLNDVRDNSYTYRSQTKDLIFLYTIFSLKNYPWEKIFINFNSEDNFINDQIVKKINLEIPNAHIRISRSSTGYEFSNFFESISENNEWIFFSPNNDHPYVGSNILWLDKLISSAEIAEKKYNKNVSIYYSHFTETINMINKNNYLYYYAGNKYKILDQNEFCFTVLTNYQPLESMQIMRKSHLINLFKTAKDQHAIRLESLDEIIPREENSYIIIVPKFECCRHYDGYLHTVNTIKHFISADLVPPLFIPDGFFEKKIKLSYGYLGSNQGSISLNDSAQSYCFNDNKYGVNLKINHKEIPNSWQDRIESIDINPTFIPNNSNIEVNKYQIINPWKNKIFLKHILVFRFFKILAFKFKKIIKKELKKII